MLRTLSAPTRRGMFVAAAAVGVWCFLPAMPIQTSEAPGRRAGMDVFQTHHIDVPEDARVDLRERIAATRWPDVQSHGVQFSTIRGREGKLPLPLALSLRSSPVVRPRRRKATKPFAPLLNEDGTKPRSNVSWVNLSWPRPSRMFSSWSRTRKNRPRPAARVALRPIRDNKLDKGGHFAASEQPELFCAEMRTSFRSLRVS
jgi:pimeloyl-ACP methyl ester carboxylesterase